MDYSLEDSGHSKIVRMDRLERFPEIHSICIVREIKEVRKAGGICLINIPSGKSGNRDQRLPTLNG